MANASAMVLPLGSLLLVCVGWLGSDALPAHRLLQPGVDTEPAQTETTVAGFDTDRGGIRYHVEPRADYDIQGLVVSTHDSNAWWDWYHQATNDRLNVVDLCVVWGANAADGAYEKMAFSSGEFVCYFSTRDSAAWQPPYIRAISNNHLLTDDDRIARRLRDVRIGDQIRMRGQLVDYTHHAGFDFKRDSSLTRDDTGNGACEVLFLRDFELLSAAPAWPRWSIRIGALGLFLALVAWFRRPYQPRD